ncbi:MAG: hypothetical protein IK074_04040 [Bacteroidales bacterium]|nr:hypothetical protein [Bacteroidales bacterium]
MTKYIGILMGLVLLASCKNLDYPDRFKETSGVPTVHYVRYADKDLVITQAAMAETICIVGDNLTSVHDIYFNDQAAVLNTSYMTAHTIVVAVPKNLPNVQDDKMHLITRDSSVVLYDFKVLPPVPKISGMSCEWAPVGETVTISGSYLFAPLTVEFPGADPIDVTVSTGDSFDVVVPAGAQPGKIKVTTASGIAQSVFMYKDSRGMLFDFDGATGLDNHGWHGPSSRDDDGTGINGRFLQMGDGNAVLDGSWEENFFYFSYWPGSWNDPENYMDGDKYTPRLCDIVDFTKWSNMALKFEMCVPASSPWSNTPMQIVTGGVDIVSFGNTTKDIYGNDCAGQNNEYMDGKNGHTMGPRVFYQPWEATGSFDTGDKWITVSIPLTEFNKVWDGSVSTLEIKPETFASIWFFICNGGVEYPEASCTPIIKIDNIRAVPIK